MAKVDPVTLEVVRSALVAYAGEMATVLRKTAYNTMIFEVQDYCVGLIDTRSELIAQNTGGLPIFLADLGVAVADGIQRFGPDGFEPGDAIIMNYPYVCGQHLNNIVVYTPCFVDGQVVAFPAVRAHWVDIGGKRVGFGAVDTTEIYHEGLQLRSIKVYKRGEPDADVLQILRDNVRFPDAALGDLRAQLAACRLGERRLTELYRKYGSETVQACISEMRNRSELLARAEVQAIPDGTYTAEAWMDNDGYDLERPVPLRVSVTVAGDGMTVDFTAVSDQVVGPINSGLSGGVAAARVAFKALTLPTHPVDEGCFRPLKVILPEGKILNARPPAALGQWSITLPTVIDTILRALAPAIPHRIPAAHKGDMGGYSIYGQRADCSPYVCLNITGGGWGGRPSGDGPSAAVSVCQGDVRYVPIELQEARYPLFFVRHALRPDSGGPGRYRGGLGIEIAVRPERPVRVNINNDRIDCPPWGLNGGGPGAVNHALVRERAGGEWVAVRKRTACPVDAGGELIFYTAGGGGWGDPYERDPAAVLADVIEGYVTADAAGEAYGVVVDAAAGTVDMVATAARRAARTTGGAMT